MVPGLIGLYRNAAVAVPTGLSEFSYATQLLTSPLTHYKVVFFFFFLGKMGWGARQASNDFFGTATTSLWVK
jgi:hypothetical protein